MHNANPGSIGESRVCPNLRILRRDEAKDDDLAFGQMSQRFERSRFAIVILELNSKTAVRVDHPMRRMEMAHIIAIQRKLVE